MLKRTLMLLLLAALAGIYLGCELEGGKLTTDPNIASQVDPEALFVGIQVSQTGVLESHLARTVAMWMQQMAGVAQHYSGYDIYNQTPAQFSAEWLDVYGGGGLLDMRRAKDVAAAQGKHLIVGMVKMWEALALSTAADLWGNIPYSQAVKLGGNIDPPGYDTQKSVHEQILNLIDSAVEDLNKGQATSASLFDFTYGANVAKWKAAGQTLKARILVNWAEVDPSKYQEALAAAQTGIANEAGNWQMKHSQTVGEENVWWQFESTRPGYIAAGEFLVELLKAHNDPRLQIYFNKDSRGNYVGSAPGQFNGSASLLNPATYGAREWNLDMVTWYENQFIVAECQYALGNEAEALRILNNVIQPGLEAKFKAANLLDPTKTPLPRYTGISGLDVLQAVMVEKYKALFLNMQVWNDWRRTAFPYFPKTAQGRNIPRRLPYSEDELNTNPNVPKLASLLYDRVQNDPGNPNYPDRPVNP
jgi:hypothetical protein